MFNKNIKLILAIALLAYGIYQIIETYTGNGIMFVLLALVFVFFYFKNEMILLAFLKHLSRELFQSNYLYCYDLFL